MKHSGFTIVELIIVLAIIAILGLIAVPAIQSAREAARKTVCSNNVKQLSLALSQYSEVAGIPPFNESGTISGWSIEILPFIDQSNQKEALSIGGPLQSLPRSLYRQPPTFRCPTQSSIRIESDDSIASAHYVLIAKPQKKRETYSIAEAPVTLNRPWVVSPEIESFDGLNPGPHNGGYFYASGFDYEVQYSER